MDGSSQGDAARVQEAEQALDQVLQELRVVQTGVQILSAFLLTLPFTVRFGSATGFEKTVYVITLVAAAVTTALVIAPVSYHRRHSAQGRATLRDVVRTAAILAQIGMATLFVSVACSVLLALDVAVGLTWAVCLTSVVAVLYVLLWYVLPMAHGPRLSHRAGRG